MSHDKIIISPDEIESMQKKHNIAPIRALPDIAPYEMLTLTQLMNETPPPIEYVFSPCLPTQGIAFIYAASGLGKTLFTLNLAYAIAGGGNFLKYECPKPRKVLYVDGEMPYNQLHNRIMQIVARHGEIDFESNFCVLTPDKIAPLRIPKIDEEDGQYIYKELALKEKVEVIVFDNLSMLTSLDENKSAEWKSVQDWFLHLRSLGITVIVVHHAGKDKNGYRGTSRMLDCVDTAISLQPVTEDGLEEENVNVKKFKVVYHKARLFGGKDALPYEVSLENGFWTYRSMDQTEMDKVIEKLNAGMNQRDIAKELLCSQSKIFKIVQKARKFGLLQK